MKRLARKLSFERGGGTARQPSTRKEARQMDTNKDGTISRDELAQFIRSKANLWAMLAVNLNLSETKCQAIATDVAYQLSKSLKSGIPMEQFTSAERQREPTVQEIMLFIDFVKTPKGEQEFFHRTVFQTYDVDGNGVLDIEEMEAFLDIFYQADSIFAGDARLPSRGMLKIKVFMDLDTDGDGQLTFEEIRSLISGGAQTLS